MTPEINIYADFMRLLGATAILSNAMAWWGRGDPKEDEIVIESIDTLIEGLSDANKIGKIEEKTGRNMRDQWTVEQVVDWEEEKRLRSWGVTRN